MAHRFINEINPGEQIDDIYMASEPILRSTSNGGLYIAAYISDKTGQLNGRMWNTTEAAYDLMPKPGFIHIQGRSELYKNNLQVIINHFSVIDSSQVCVEDFLARTTKDIDQMFSELKKIVGAVKNPQIKVLIEEFLTDSNLMDKFCNAPAAVKLHHNCIGGLLEHTHHMLKVAEAILSLYPQVQQDLVLAGVFLHDIGKTEELSYDMTFSYTDSGQLIGHITKSFLMMNQKADLLAAKGKAIDKEILDALGHIILSHHGQYEFGSPKLPATPEAFMVNYIDDLDAKISQVTSAIDDGTDDSNWTGWKNALQTRIYKKRIE